MISQSHRKALVVSLSIECDWQFRTSTSTQLNHLGKQGFSRALFCLTECLFIHSSLESFVVFFFSSPSQDISIRTLFFLIAFFLLVVFVLHSNNVFLYTFYHHSLSKSLQWRHFLFLLIHAYENSIYKLFVLKSIEIASNDDKFTARFFYSRIFESKSCFSSFFFFLSQLFFFTFLNFFFSPPNWNVMLWINEQKLMLGCLRV